MIMKLSVKMFMWIAAGIMVSGLAFAQPAPGANAKLEAAKPALTNPAKSLMVSKAKPEFTIRLKDNPTTGYSWYLMQYNSQLIDVVKHSYEAPHTDLVGAPGISVWQFRLKPEAFTAPHLTTITLGYTRPWETKSITKQTFTVISYGCQGPMPGDKDDEANVAAWVC